MYIRDPNLYSHALARRNLNANSFGLCKQEDFVYLIRSA